MANILKPIKKY